MGQMIPMDGERTSDTDLYAPAVVVDFNDIHG